MRLCPLRVAVPSICAALALAGAAQAAPVGASLGGNVALGSNALVTPVKRGGHVKHGWKGNRGLHRGWRLGRGNPHRLR